MQAAAAAAAAPPLPAGAAVQQGPEAGVESPQEEELLSLLDSNSLSGGRT